MATKKIHVIGNSLDHHPLAPYWWGTWGVAATNRRLDWKHRLVSMIIKTGQCCSVTGFYAAAWEADPAGYDKSNFDALLVEDLSLVIIRIGENVQAANYGILADELTSLINYIKTKVACPIMVGGLFWDNATKLAALIAGAAAADVPFVDLTSFTDRLDQVGMGTMVYGDDGAWHEIAHAGVAAHASDAAMLAVATALYPKALELLS